MSTQSPALHLAAYWSAKNDQGEYLYSSLDFREDTAAELRRLHAENESLRQIVEDFPSIEAELVEVSDHAHKVKTQRDQLLEALKRILQWDKCGLAQTDASVDDLMNQARAAIAAVEGEKE